MAFFARAVRASDGKAMTILVQTGADGQRELVIGEGLRDESPVMLVLRDDDVAAFAHALLPPGWVVEERRAGPQKKVVK